MPKGSGSLSTLKIFWVAFKRIVFFLEWYQSEGMIEYCQQVCQMNYKSLGSTKSSVTSSAKKMGSFFTLNHAQESRQIFSCPYSISKISKELEQNAPSERNSKQNSKPSKQKHAQCSQHQKKRWIGGNGVSKESERVLTAY